MELLLPVLPALLLDPPGLSSQVLLVVLQPGQHREYQSQSKLFYYEAHLLEVYFIFYILLVNNH